MDALPLGITQTSPYGSHLLAGSNLYLFALIKTLILSIGLTLSSVYHSSESLSPRNSGNL